LDFTGEFDPENARRHMIQEIMDIFTYERSYMLEFNDLGDSTRFQFIRDERVRRVNRTALATRR